MTEEDRWRIAVEAEVVEPSDWSPDRDAIATAYRERLKAAGCQWADLAVWVVIARSRARVDRDTFAARIGFTEAELRALEGHNSIR